MKKLSIIFLFTLMVQLVVGQNFTSTIRGTVVDNTLQQPLPGATVILIGSNPPRGATADINGKFVIENVPVGRVGVKASFIGFKEIEMNQLQVNTGKELILNITLEENITQMKEVVISATREKAQVRNEMATVSARTFSVEESQRFAGARNDVSRMAMNFAGVRGANDAVNDIIIRGNSSAGLLWRYNGVDIPNQNHFGQFGGTVKIISEEVFPQFTRQVYLLELNNKDVVFSKVNHQWGSTFFFREDMPIKESEFHRLLMGEDLSLGN